MHTNALYIPRAEQMSDEFNYIILTRAHGFLCILFETVTNRNNLSRHCKSQTTANVKNKSIEILSIRNKIRSRLEYFLYLFFVLILHFGQVRALRQNPQKKIL